MGFYKLNQMVTPIAVAPSNVVLFLEQIDIFPGIWHRAIDVANALYSLPVSKDQEKHFTFGCLRQQYITTILPKGYTSSPALFHNLVCRNLNYLFFQQDFMIVHFIYNIQLIGKVVKIATTLGIIQKHLCQWIGNKLHNYSKAGYLMKFLQIQSMAHDMSKYPF